jgi:SNF2 family DNA or RNA helicase
MLEFGDESIEVPSSLWTRMFEHQKLGVQWLANNFHSEYHGCILGDDMGLGKTFQICTLLTWYCTHDSIEN